MKQDEIIEMARQAGIHGDAYLLYPHRLEAFAKLVTDKEREACAKRASIALLGTLKTTSDRVLTAIRARGEA